METILIIDDEPESLEALNGILSSNGYKVRATINVELALKSAQKYVPDLILLDICLPGTDGFEACKTIFG